MPHVTIATHVIEALLIRGTYRVEWQPRTVSSVATGFIRHREQGDMMFASKHHLAQMTCAILPRTT